MQRGSLFLVVILDWLTGNVTALRISNTLKADFCVAALNEAIHRFGAPEIMDTDQLLQVAANVRINRLRRSGLCISMDGNGCQRDR